MPKMAKNKAERGLQVPVIRFKKIFFEEIIVLQSEKYFFWVFLVYLGRNKTKMVFPWRLFILEFKFLRCAISFFVGSFICELRSRKVGHVSTPFWPKNMHHSPSNI